MSLIISQKKKYIFFHLPKNAGVSISRALINQEKTLKIKRTFTYFQKFFLKKKDSFYLSFNPFEFFFYNSHIPCYQFYSYFKNSNILEGYYKFAVVRNSWDRMVSRYFYSKKISRKFQSFSFEEFIDYDLKNNMHVLQQHEFCTNDKKNICLNKVIMFENLEKDLDEVTLNLFGKTGLLKHDNKTDHKLYREYYNSKLEKKVYDAFEKDINFFKFSF
jgi:hypothetical protein